MPSPSTSIYVRPGWTSYTWTYQGTTAAFAGGESAITAVSLDFGPYQPVTRGNFQYSLDGGRSWLAYTLGTTGYVTASALWRYVDLASGDTITPGQFTMHWQLANGALVTSDAAVIIDNPPAGIVDNRDTVFATTSNGETVATLVPIDTGSPTGGRWVIDSQSHPGLFTLAVNADGSAALVLANNAAMPAAGSGVTVTAHYYDRFQLDSNGNPHPGHGVVETLVYNIVDGVSQDLTGFGADFALGTAAGAQSAPALARLSDGSFAGVWQGPGAAVWAQVRDPMGNAKGAAFALSTGGDAAIESEPSVAALGNGRFVVAYTVRDGAGSHIGYRIADASGAVGPELAAGWGDASAASVAALADGSFVLGWRSGGMVHTMQASGATGAALGAAQVNGVLASAFSPAVAALPGGGYVAAWGEAGDGNIYLSLNGGAARQVTSDGTAASITTAAPLPHVAALAGGGFVVAWDSYANDQRGYSMSDVFFQRYDNAGNRLGQVTQANMDSGSGRYDASVAALTDGSFVIGWQVQGGDYDGYGLYGRRFGADGTAIDPREFGINQVRKGDQANVDLVALDGGGFAAAWTDTQGGVASIEARVLAGLPPSGNAGSGQSSGSGTGQTGSSGGGQVGSGGTTGGTSGGDTGSGGSTSGGGQGTTPTPTTVLGTAGNNFFTATAGHHKIDGGAGMDTVHYLGVRSGYTVTLDAGSIVVSDKAGTVRDALVNVERVKFSDVWLALDINGTAGKAFRLYQAAFDRAPDLAGLGYWIKMLDSGVTLDQVSAGFVASREFADMYGASPSDSHFVSLLYQHVLHRPAEGAGYDFWMNALHAGQAPRAEVLSAFSESAENQAQVIGSIQDGMAFVPWG